MSSSQQASPVHSRAASPDRQLSRSRSRSPSPRRYSRSRSSSPQQRRRSRSRSFSSSSEDERDDAMTDNKYNSMTMRGRKAYNRRVKERNLFLERSLVTMRQTLYTEV